MAVRQGIEELRDRDVSVILPYEFKYILGLCEDGITFTASNFIYMPQSLHRPRRVHLHVVCTRRVQRDLFVGRLLEP